MSTRAPHPSAASEGAAPHHARDARGQETCDVAIVGYGPVGQALAAMLGSAGHDVQVFERHNDIYPLPRAVHLDHEIMRLLQMLGVARELEDELLPIREYHWFGADGEPIFTLQSSSPAVSGWEPDYMFFQPCLEEALDRAARRHESVTVQRGCEVERIELDGAGARLTVRPVCGGEQRSVSARFVIGADGANSLVRSQARIPCRDLGFREQWVVVDVLPRHIAALSSLPDACQWCDPARPHMHARNGTRHRRWEFMLLPGESADDFAEPGRIWELLAPFIRADEGELTRHTVYEFRSMLAEQMRRGPVLLAGDAAHLTPPFMGQGLCAGMRDALNIAWKLDLVLRGIADDSLLDTVTAERQTQNEWITALAVEMGRVSCELDPAAAAERDAALRAADAPPPLQLAPLTGGVTAAARDGRPQPLAGTLAVQGRVSAGGREGLFDDVVGRGVVLINAHAEDLECLPDAQRGHLERLGVKVAALDGMRDLDGRLTAWMADHDACAVLVRPDFYTYGSAATAAELPPLLDELLATIDKETHAHA